jgi:hypothetical protein
MDADDAAAAEVQRPIADLGLDPLALDGGTAERLLNGELAPAQAPPGYAEVVALLAATLAAPSPAELAGQAAAVAELHAMIRTGPAAGIGRRVAKRSRRRRVGLAVVVVVVVGALATGGAAAAATGRLPGPIQDAAGNILVTVGGPEPAPPPQPGRPPAPTTRDPDAGEATTAPPGPQPAGATGHGRGPTATGSVASPDKQGLCRAFIAGQDQQQGKKLDGAAFKALAEMAGGATKVTTYCQGTPPGDAKPKKQKPPPPDDRRQGQDGPPDTRPQGG